MYRTIHSSLCSQCVCWAVYRGADSGPYKRVEEHGMTTFGMVVFLVIGLAGVLGLLLLALSEDILLLLRKR